MTDQLRRAFDYRNAEAARRRLERSLEKKLLTSFVGAISSCEEVFGHLWAHGGEPQTDNQRAWLAAWERLRHAVLEKGNAQIRSMRAELGGYRFEEKVREDS